MKPFIQKIISLCKFLLLCSIFVSSQSAQASGPANRKSQHVKVKSLHIPNNVLFASVILMPTGVSYRSMMTEEQLRDDGCTFNTLEPSHINSLVNVLKHANIITAIHADDFLEFEPRAGVYLTLDNEVVVKLLFSRAFTNVNHVRGTYSKKASIKYRAITANESLPKNLLTWALEVGNPLIQGKNSGMQLECESFMKKTGYYSR